MSPRSVNFYRRPMVAACANAWIRKLDPRLASPARALQRTSAFGVKGAVAAELRDECSQAGVSFVTVESAETER